MHNGKVKVPEHNYTERELTVVQILKNEIGSGLKSLLNVGFHHWNDPRKHWWIKICEANNIDWKIVEVFGPNILNAIADGCPEHKITQKNIMDVDALPEADCLMFWHGPEHLDKTEFLKILPDLESKYGTLIFGMPLGSEPQGAVYGNPDEEHVSAWTTQEWKDLGYVVIEVHDKRVHQHITAYKGLV